MECVDCGSDEEIMWNCVDYGSDEEITWNCVDCGSDEEIMAFFSLCYPSGTPGFPQKC